MTMSLSSRFKLDRYLRNIIKEKNHSVPLDEFSEIFIDAIFLIIAQANSSVSINTHEMFQSSPTMVNQNNMPWNSFRQSPPMISYTASMSSARPLMLYTNVSTMGQNYFPFNMPSMMQPIYSASQMQQASEPWMQSMNNRFQQQMYGFPQSALPAIQPQIQSIYDTPVRIPAMGSNIPNPFQSIIGNQEMGPLADNNQNINNFNDKSTYEPNMHSWQTFESKSVDTSNIELDINLSDINKDNSSPQSERSSINDQRSSIISVNTDEYPSMPTPMPSIEVVDLQSHSGSAAEKNKRTKKKEC